MKKKKVQAAGWATAHFALGHDTAGMDMQGMDHDTTKARPRHGRACAIIRRAVREIQPSTHARVAWLAESVAIQRLYCGLGWPLCRNRGSDTGCDTAQDASRYSVVRA